MSNKVEELLKKCRLYRKLFYTHYVITIAWILGSYGLYIVSAFLGETFFGAIAILLFLAYGFIGLIVITVIGIYRRFYLNNIAKELTLFFIESEEFEEQEISYLKIKYYFYQPKIRRVIFSKTKEELYINLEVLNNKK